MKHFFTVVLILFLASCTRREPVSELFRWPAIEPEADSLVVALEQGYMDALPVDSLMITAGKLGAVASRSDAPAQLRARYYFWKGRLENRRHNIAAAKHYMRRAAALSDSSAYPYDAMRIRYLGKLLDPGPVVGYYRVLKESENFARRSGDRFMLATAKLDIGHIIFNTGDLGRSLVYYMEADSLYQSVGALPYHIKTSLNNAAQLHEMGRRREADSILTLLRRNPVARADQDFYTTLLREAYTIQGDTSALREAYRRLKTQPRKSWRYIEVLTDLAGMNLAADRVAEAERFAAEAIDSIGARGETALRAKATAILAQAKERLGKQTEALEARRRLNADQDSMLASRTDMEIGNLENRARILEYEEDLKHQRITERLLVAVGLLGILSAVLVAWVIIMRRSHRHKIQIARYQLDLERERRQLVSSAAVMKEKDNVLQAVLQDIGRMESEGKLGHAERHQIEQQVRMHLSGKQERDSFRVLFDRAHPDFSRTLRRLYPGISEGDVRLATYIRIGMQTKQIARMLMLQPDSIKKNRQRLRRRMGLAADESLEDALARI